MNISIGRINVGYKMRLITLLLILSFLGCALTRHTQLMEKIGPFVQLKDGKYRGSNFNTLCRVNLEVTVKGGKIENIEILSKVYSWPFAARAYKKIPPRIIDEQSLDVDAITAATISTNNIKAAVLKALEKAKTK